MAIAELKTNVSVSLLNTHNKMAFINGGKQYADEFLYKDVNKHTVFTLWDDFIPQPNWRESRFNSLHPVQGHTGVGAQIQQQQYDNNNPFERTTSHITNWERKGL